MWGRTNDTKQPLSTSEPPAAPAPAASPRPAPAPAAEPRAAKTMLSRAVSLKGELSGREDVCIDGEFEGQIRVSGASVTIGANGRVAAEVEADEIFVEGRIEGTLRAHQRAVIRRSGHVTGDLEAQRLIIEEGAFFSGRVEMALPGAARAARPAVVARAEREEHGPVPLAASEPTR
jgi:cytoskeletal protein CcmA (bactofilin family)